MGTLVDFVFAIIKQIFGLTGTGTQSPANAAGGVLNTGAMIAAGGWLYAHRMDTLTLSFSVGTAAVVVAGFWAIIHLALRLKP